jgi:hypothetical protein
MRLFIMQSDKWGSHAWFFLHTVTFNYPLKPIMEDQRNIIGLFSHIGPNLPCSICRDSFVFFYGYIPINDFTEDRYGVVYWLYILHSIVNYKLNKPNITFEKVIQYYEALRVSNEEPVTNEYINNFISIAKNKYQSLIDKKIAHMLKNNSNKKEVIAIINRVKLVN